MCPMVVVVVDKEGCAQGKMISLTAQQHVTRTCFVFFEWFVWMRARLVGVVRTGYVPVPID